VEMLYDYTIHPQVRLFRQYGKFVTPDVNYGQIMTCQDTEKPYQLDP